MGQGPQETARDAQEQEANDTGCDGRVGAGGARVERIVLLIQLEVQVSPHGRHLVEYSVHEEETRGRKEEPSDRQGREYDLLGEVTITDQEDVRIAEPSSEQHSQENHPPAAILEAPHRVHSPDARIHGPMEDGGPQAVVRGHAIAPAKWLRFVRIRIGDALLRLQVIILDIPELAARDVAWRSILATADDVLGREEALYAASRIGNTTAGAH
mmetsp:Transcript_114992/g.245585  ORF Transcript_114992/g.245585 Transcript_114992/m.245585 type:complete len:213 (-) Transcript_114992:594-1232(-)